MHAAGPVTGQQKTDHGTKWQMKTVGDHDELVSGSGDPGNWRTLRRVAVPLCPITHELSTILYTVVRTNQRISPSCLTLNLPPPRPQRALTSNSSSTMPWTNTRNGRRTTCLHIPSPSSSNLAILPLRFSPSFISKFRDQISPKAVMNGGQGGLIQPSTSFMFFPPHSERVLVWYVSGLSLSGICTFILIWQAFSPATVIFSGIGVLLSVRILLNSFVLAILTPTSPRQPRMLEQAKTFLSTFLSALRCFSDVSRSIRRCRRPQR